MFTFTVLDAIAGGLLLLGTGLLAGMFRGLASGRG